ncbi:DNA-binding transcriptional dual regulator TorR [Rhodovastum atsumiense]|uniref:Regulatory protein VirG n=1 Tax=Rhodovastum atsumiense TaxID=504468 RepID=A0A5M6IW39_9PROT|nr:response regulator [Rhodovastum atsumiense]KAA5612550.1 response regulator [Rhodovastum atsumiense]CAH2601365.1 DNA-binding transcriptional dual regulator TorR [Rhodovastum atsumiense]
MLSEPCTTRGAAAQGRHVLVVDDEPVARESITAYFEREGFRVTAVGSGAGLRAVLARETPDLLLLDIRLPDEDGLAIMRELRAQSALPVILVSARGDEVDRVLGLELGADDYVTKPFSPRELLARARTVLRRIGASSYSSGPDRMVRRFAGWSIDFSLRRLTSPGGEEVRLTRGEFDLLAALARRPGHVLTRDSLLDAISHRDWAPNDRTVDVLVARLRRKIEADPAHPRLIVTEHGIGYALHA